ncbi:MAG: leucyl aminopeptidase family protein [Actinomycetota bacterium]
MTVEASHDATEIRGADLLVVMVPQGEEAGSGGARRAFATAGMTGKIGEALLVASTDATAELLVGVGPREGLDPGILRRALGVAAPTLRGYATVGIPSYGDAANGGSLTAAAEGVLLGAHRFERYRTKTDGRRLGRVLMEAPSGLEAVAADEAIQRGVVSAEAGIEARDLVNTPANHCTPEHLAIHAESLAEGSALEVEVWREDELARERCGGILGVGRGSAMPPRLILLSYRGAGDEPPLAFAGKGVTYDAGGMSLKLGDDLEYMKFDMSGGAAILAAMHAIARLGLPVNVVGAVASADNVSGPTATKPGDVLALRNGRTCEIVNTDYEGRVVLADALDVLRERSPSAIVVAATLWGGGETLGDQISPLLGNDDELIQEVLRAAADAGEPAWQLPLWPPYRRELKSSIADLKNKPADKGAVITAAMFLGEFTGDVPWAYLDIGDTAWAGARWDLGEAGATGVPARTLLHLAHARAHAG